MKMEEHVGDQNTHICWDEKIQEMKVAHGLLLVQTQKDFN
jgi:hypothetical protein